jgi:hypothetical protein
MKDTRLIPKMTRTVSNTDNCNLPRRRCGNTTRIIDAVIQDLFAGKLCLIVDHHPNGFVNLWPRILDRIHMEHRRVFDTYLCVNKEEHLMWIDPAYFFLNYE